MWRTCDSALRRDNVVVTVEQSLDKHAEISLGEKITQYSQLGSKHQRDPHRHTNDVVGHQVGQRDHGLHPRADENPRGRALKTHTCPI